MPVTLSRSRSWEGDGKIAEEGTPQQVIDNPVNERVRAFLSVAVD